MNRWRMSIASAVVVMVPGVTCAQATFRLTPLFATAQVYDTNLFSTATARDVDLVTRLSPGVDVAYRTPRFTLAGQYTFDAERFADHAQLTRMDARQHGAVALTHRLTARLAFAADLNVTKTHTPGELLTAQNGLALTRANASQVAGHSSVTRRIDALTAGTIGYGITDERIAGGVEGRVHTVAISGKRRVSARSTANTEYRVQRFSLGTSATTSHTLQIGWLHALAPRLTVSVDAGPRLTNGSVTPNLSASLRYHPDPTDWSIAYTRTQSNIIGFAALADIQSFTTSLAWRSRRSGEVRVVPGVFRTVTAASRADVYHLMVEGVRPIRSHFAVSVTSDSYLQHGTVNASLSRDVIPRHTLTLKLVTNVATTPR